MFSNLALRARLKKRNHEYDMNREKVLKCGFLISMEWPSFERPP